MQVTYIAIQTEINGKFNAEVIKVTDNHNILNKLKSPYIIAANVFRTNKKAKQTVKKWVETFKKNDEYEYQ